MSRAGMCVSRSGMSALICALGAAAGCADLFGPDEPDVTVSLEALPPSAAARPLRVVVGDRAMEVPAPPSGRAREERTLRAPGFGTQLVEVALVGAAGDTLAAATFPQDFQRHSQHWVTGLVGPRRPIGACVGSVAIAPVRGGANDTLFVMYGGLPDGAFC